MDSIKPIGGKRDLPRYFALAHEAAHHINGDTLFADKWDKDEELKADYAAAVWLARLGVTKTELLQAFNALALKFLVESVSGYLTRAERRDSVIRGYEDGKQPESPQDPRPPRQPRTLPAASMTGVWELQLYRDGRVTNSMRVMFQQNASAQGGTFEYAPGGAQPGRFRGNWSLDGDRNLVWDLTPQPIVRQSNGTFALQDASWSILVLVRR